MTTLQTILQTLRFSGAVEPAKVNYGVSDNLEPPYVSVQDFKAELERDTGGPAFRNSTYRVVAVAKSVEEAEDIADKVFAALDQEQVTPTTVGHFQESYQVGQFAEKLYQFGVDMGYALRESLPGS